MGLDAVELVLWAENRFGIDIPPDVAETLVTVGALTDYVHRQVVNESFAVRVPRAEIFDSIKAYLVNQLGIRPELITSEAKFVQDLGLQ